MKVLQIMAGDVYGGAENFFIRLVCALSEAGLDQEVILKPHTNRESVLKDKNIPVTTASFNRLFSFGTRQSIQSVIGRYCPDIVMTWMSRASALCPRGDFVHVGRLGGYYDLKYYQKCDYLVGNTEDIVHYFHKEGWDDHFTHYLPNFVDPPQHKRKIAKETFDTPEDAPLLLSLGRLHTDKGFDVLIQAMEEIPSAYLWIVGAGEERDNLTKQIAQTHVQERIKLIDWQEDISSLYNTCDIYVCPSRIEPLGNVILEAWAHRKPVVAAKSKGPKGLIQNEKTGLLAALEDHEGLAIAINRFLQNPSLKKKLAQAGYRYYKDHFTKDAVVGQYLTFFEQIKGKKRTGTPQILKCEFGKCVG